MRKISVRLRYVTFLKILPQRMFSKAYLVHYPHPKIPMCRTPRDMERLAPLLDLISPDYPGPYGPYFQVGEDYLNIVHYRGRPLHLKI